MSEAALWRVIAVLSIVAAGASIGNEAAVYFWDLTVYVASLDSPYPYRFETPYPFLYPPFALDLFTLARSHLFELFSVGYCAALWLFLDAFARLNVSRRFEWLLAITAMGGLGTVSLLSGNVGVILNLAVLAAALHAARGNLTAITLLPLVIGAGALIKPQFAIYLGLLLCVERSRAIAVMKALVVSVAVTSVHGAYLLLRPDDWNEYVQAVIKRTMEVRDFGWGPAAFITRFTDWSGAPFAGYLAGLLIVAGLAYATWRRSLRSGRPIDRIAVMALGFVVLTFANPRMPLYDLYAAGIALVICCALAVSATGVTWILVPALAINLMPWLIANFARVPSAYPWWIQDLQITHLLGIAALLCGLARVGVGSLSASPADERSARG